MTTMKLLRSITRTYIITTVIALILFTGVIFFLVTVILKSNIDEQLVNNKERMMRNYTGDPVMIFPFVEIKQIPVLPPRGSDILKDTSIYNPVEKEYENFREYVSFVESGNTSYMVIIRSSLIEQEDLFTAFIAVFGISSLLLLTALFFITKRTTRTLLAPFYRTLSQLQTFSLRNLHAVPFERTPIEEFNELNSIVTELTARAGREYTALKEFSENASHELQTPLAIIRSKLDLLIQKENLDEEQKQSIESIYQNINKLTQLNKALLLLSRIESDGFAETQTIDIAAELRRELETFSTIAEFKNITISYSILDQSPIIAHPVLINIVIKNLLSNAVKHNNERGIVNVRLANGIFSVENTGPQPADTTEKLFERFHKESPSADSTGLGLSIVKEICLLYHFILSYSYNDGFHRIVVTMDSGT